MLIWSMPLCEFNSCGRLLLPGVAQSTYHEHKQQRKLICTGTKRVILWLHHGHGRPCVCHDGSDSDMCEMLCCSQEHSSVSFSLVQSNDSIGDGACDDSGFLKQTNCACKSKRRPCGRIHIDPLVYIVHAHAMLAGVFSLRRGENMIAFISYHC